MAGKSFLDAFGGGFLIGGTILGFLFATFWLEKRICDQDEGIEELFSRLEDCEEQFSCLEENHELKK